MSSRYGSRKFIASLAALAGAQWGLLIGLLPSADYRLIVLGVVGVYVAGNVGQKAVERPKEQP